VHIWAKSNKKKGAETMINSEDYQIPPKEGFILTHFLFMMAVILVNV
jgi:hypothetical protein